MKIKFHDRFQSSGLKKSGPPDRIDEDTDRILTELASEYNGDLSQALADLHAHEGLEAFAERSEAVHENTLRTLRDRAEEDFREGRTVTWKNVKARSGL